MQQTSEISQEICNYFLQERASWDFKDIIITSKITTDEMINTSEYLKILEQVNNSLKALEDLAINYINNEETPLRTDSDIIAIRLQMAILNNQWILV